MWGKNEGKPEGMPVHPAASAGPVAVNPPQQRQSVPAAPAPPAPSAAAASMGRTTRIHGEVYSEEELHLDGEVEGAIEVKNRLTIGANGKVKASIKAREIVVRGSVQGDVEASDRVSIMNGASIVGDVKTAGIVIEDGAYFKGGIDILRPDAAKKPQHQEAAPSPAPAPAAAPAPAPRVHGAGSPH